MSINKFTFCWAKSFKSRFLAAMNDAGIVNNTIIESRYIDIVTNTEFECRLNTFLYIFLTNLITIGGVLLVSFLSLDRAIATEATTNIFFWTCLILSILVTVANKTLYVFAIPRKYLLNIILLEKYYSEGWSFLAGVGKYTNCVNMQEKVKLFCSRIERIKLKSVDAISSVEASGVEKISHGLSRSDAIIEIGAECNSLYYNGDAREILAMGQSHNE